MIDGRANSGRQSKKQRVKMQKLQPVDFLPFAEETSGDTDAKLFPQLRSDLCQGSSTAELFAAAADHL